ncbi:SDR family oxidoreductase [Mangrovimicrobium sediminis]|uniref:SDR family oxidoreductase n=1 Tax=Mangrovimicrobium sediminis TaxID=2562682 RepID=A0A4Z0M211_9GAMM|nr:SDR family NAD(P)-dependent oxidoreductase [Haliea sp. SAOS-164]TGD73315.1 SDR family oxidoreductase [Haliea sp. SAOS-164]
MTNTSSRTALVTGGAVGMGEACCRRLARDGMAVGVLDINGETAAEVAAAINAEGGRALALTANIADRAQVAAALEQLRAAFGPIGVLVNNAGVEDFTPFEEIEPDTWSRIIEINLNGTYNVTQAALVDMEAQGWGRIINFASIAAQTGGPNMVHYSAAKGGIVSMTRSLALEVGRKGITVNAVAPGLVDTPMARRAIDGGKFPVPLEQMLAAYPIPRMGRAEEVAATVAFFASEDAGYITAQLIGINGGTAV